MNQGEVIGSRLARRVVERQRKNLTLFKTDKFLCNESQRPLAPSNLRGGANMQWDKGFAENLEKVRGNRLFAVNLEKVRRNRLMAANIFYEIN